MANAQVVTRTLRSKRQRALLWRAADGHCQRCGKELGQDWEADHRVPWVILRQTNVHEMEALCKRCNREKGTGMLRQHQQDFDGICREIVGGRPIKRVFMQVTPGGGKSLLPIIAAQRLIPRTYDKIAWVVPRGALRRQAEANFVDPGLGQIVPHEHMIRISVNDLDPSRGLCGFVTTYQAVQADPKTLADELARHRYILVLDEPHHLEMDGVWHRAIAPAVERAALTIFMSGTWDRGKRYKIAYLPYRPILDGYGLDLPAPGDVTSAVAAVNYPRRSALAERAIIPLRFFHLDGEVTWSKEDAHSDRTSTLSEVSAEDAPQAIFTALNTDYARQLLDLCVREWTGYRMDHPRSKMLVVADRQENARQYLKRLRAGGVRRVDIAISAEDSQAEAAIERFGKAHNRPDALDALVTVAMAYEGLDNKAITHIPCLTRIRARSWIEQMAARACRHDDGAGPYGEQYGFVYCPDDPLMNKIIRQIQAEQAPFVKDPGEGPPPGPSGTQRSVLALRGEFTEARESDLATGDVLPQGEYAHITAIFEEEGVRGRWDPLDFHRAAMRYQRERQTGHDSGQQGTQGQHSEAEPMPSAPIPPSVREDRIRKKMAEYIREREGERKRAAEARGESFDWGTINYEAKVFFQKAPEEMSLPELERRYEWLRDIYPPM